MHLFIYFTIPSTNFSIFFVCFFFKYEMRQEREREFDAIIQTMWKSERIRFFLYFRTRILFWYNCNVNYIERLFHSLLGLSNEKKRKICFHFLKIIFDDVFLLFFSLCLLLLFAAIVNSNWWAWSGKKWNFNAK